MKQLAMPAAMWAVFQGSFTKHLPILNVAEPAACMRKAKRQYREIIRSLPAYGKDDVLLVNLLSAAMVAAIYLSLDEKAGVAQMKAYYSKAMGDSFVATRLFKSRDFYSKKYQDTLSAGGERSQRATNPYTWRYKVIPGETLDSFDAIFDKCGIFELYKHLDISEITPALCAYDYDMAELTNTVFTREYTLAGGGPVCDCHYRRRRGACEAQSEFGGNHGL